MRVDKYYLLVALTFLVGVILSVGSYLITYNLSKSSFLNFSRENALNYVETGAVLYGSKEKIGELKSILDRAPYILKVEVEKGAPESPFQVSKTLIFPDGKVSLLITLNRSLIKEKASLLASKVAFLTLLLTGFTLTLYLIVLNRLYFRPLREIGKDADSISEGSLKELPISGSDEFGRVRGSINRMIRSIRERDERAELMSSFVSLLTVEEGLGDQFTFLMKKLLKITGFDGILVGIVENRDLLRVKCITRYQEREFLKSFKELEDLEEYLLELGKELEVKKEGSLLSGRLKYGYAFGLPLISFSKVKGYILFFKKNLSELKDEDKLFIKSIARSIAVAVEISSLIKSLKSKLKEESDLLKRVLRNFIRGVEIREPYCEGHSERVAYYCKRIAQEMGLTQEEIDSIYLGGLLHDIGKVGIPDTILLKPSKLTEREYDLVEFHPLLGYELLKDLGFPKETLDGIKHHHERWDGKGYPQGLKGNEIPLSARIVAVADSFETMTGKRIYRDRKEREEAVKELLELSGKVYDPLVVKTAVDIFLKEEPPKPEEELSGWVIDEVKERRFDYFFRDSITGVFNKNAVDLAFKVAKDRFGELSCILIKIFGFKGERELAEFINSIVREIPESVLVNYSDNFLLLFLPPYSLSGALTKLKELEREFKVNLQLRKLNSLKGVKALKKEIEDLSSLTPPSVL